MSGFQFVHHDLGQRQRGEIVEISLSGNAANVRLMDSSNFQSYRSGHNHRYIGGLAKQSPVRLQIPTSGHWHVAVDLTGLSGTCDHPQGYSPAYFPHCEKPLCRLCQACSNRAGRQHSRTAGVNTTYSFRMRRKTRMRSSVLWRMP